MECRRRSLSDCDNFIGLMTDFHFHISQQLADKTASFKMTDSCSAAVTDPAALCELEPNDDIDVNVDWCHCSR